MKVRVAASALPELRNALVDDRQLWVHMTEVDYIMGKADFEQADHIQDELAAAQLWWVGLDASELVAQVAPSMPGTTLTEDLIPDESGFAYWATPIDGLSADDSDQVVEVWASQWFRTVVAGRECISHVPWSGMHSTGTGVPLLPMGRADWPIGDDTDTPLPGVGDLAMASIIEDRRLLAALWVLSNQPGLMQVGLERLGRPERRRIERQGRSVPVVRYVHLPLRNMPVRPADGGEGVEGGREYHVRWMVKGHWRQQAYGPGWTLRRPTFIHPHIKGPAGAPVREAVKVWQG